MRVVKLKALLMTSIFLLVNFLTTPITSSASESESNLDFQWSTISAGSGMTCAIDVQNSLKCWVGNYAWDGSEPYSEKEVPFDFGKVQEVSVGSNESLCVITESSDAKCWSAENTNGVADVPTNLGKVVQISTGSRHACAITIAGLVKCWGNNIYSQVSIPSDLTSTQVIQVSAGGLNTCVVTFALDYKCWGNNEYGQIRNQKFKVKQIVAGNGHICALPVWPKEEVVYGKPLCWGDRQAIIDVPPYFPSASQISTQNWTSCAVTLIEEVECWGPSDQRYVPADLGKVLQITVTQFFACAITIDKMLKCWNLNGTNNSGALGEVRDPKKLPTLESPELQGSGLVGSLLTLNAGAAEVGTDLKVVWLVDGQSVSESSEYYEVGINDLGKTIKVLVTSKRWTFNDASVASNSIQVPNLLKLPTLKCNKGSNFEDGIPVDPTNWRSHPYLPSIEGVPKHNQTLVSTVGLWDTGTKLCVAWIDQNTEILKEDSQSLKISEKMRGKTIRVIVYGSNNGKTNIRISLPVIVGPGYYFDAVNPMIKGIGKPGTSLSLNNLSWAAQANYTFQWTLGGKSIPKATTKTYKIKPSDKGKRIGVKVCATKTSYQKLCLDSSNTILVRN